MEIKLRLPLRDIFVTQPWGVNFFDFYQKMGLPYHPGVDFRARSGCKLYASNGGKVINCGTYSDGGLGIEIQYPAGWSSFYYHLKEILVKIGDTVIAGDLIGLTNNTGKFTTADHLHLELRVNGKKINPAGYFTSAYDGFPIGTKDWDKSRCYHRYYRKDKRNLLNEMKTALYMARRLKRLPNNEEINMAIWGSWSIENIMNPAMYGTTSQLTRGEFVDKKLIPFQ